MCDCCFSDLFRFHFYAKQPRRTRTSTSSLYTPFKTIIIATDLCPLLLPIRVVSHRTERHFISIKPRRHYRGTSERYQPTTSRAADRLLGDDIQTICCFVDEKQEWSSWRFCYAFDSGTSSFSSSGPSTSDLMTETKFPFTFLSGSPSPTTARQIESQLTSDCGPEHSIPISRYRFELQ